MNERIASHSSYWLPYPRWIRDVIFAILSVESGGTTGESSIDHLPVELRRTHYTRQILSLLQALGYFTTEMEPTEDWNQLMKAEPRIRREMLRAVFEDAFRAPDGSSATEAIQTISDSRGRIDWFVQKHGLSRSTSAAYAEQLYRRALAAFDAAASPDTLDEWAYLQGKRQPAAVPATPPPEEAAAIPKEAIRAVPRSHEHRSKGIELVFWLPDDADSSVYERIFQAADATIFSKEGHWDPFRDVDPRQVRLNIAKSDQSASPPAMNPPGLPSLRNDSHLGRKEENATQS